MNPEPSKALPITLRDAKGNSHTFIPDTQGMFNLTEMHCRLGLANSKRPAQWRTSISRDLAACANLHSLVGSETLGTEVATIAYAMWVSNDFYKMVVSVFIAVRSDALLSAQVYERLAMAHQELFADNCYKLRAYSRIDNKNSMTWTVACDMYGIERPLLAKQYIYETHGFWRIVCGEVAETGKGRATGFYVRNRGNNGPELDLAPGARDWLLHNVGAINFATKPNKRYRK
ncbi:KilA-N domain-containing protein [Pseudomonas sp. RL_105y_Pfl2_101]|uniref:KilA-N domain-containing protein n=1 Tax=Pseudomonas sp. RL_105y_Pfl2_101 TaxID=3088708 RepID=UPI0030D84F12